jgi:hypothetical protein
VLYVKFYMLPFHLVKTTLMFCKAVVIPVHNVLRFVFVVRSVILRNV